jgi:dinuclear metal center YbgI/SA1388 family protein
MPSRYRRRRGMGAPLTDIIAELDRLLEPGRFEDYCPNGLQVPGREEVATVVTGVSAHLELFERAAAEGADLLLVHHGTFWNSEPRALDVARKRRLKTLFNADMGLAAYHLPLDAHPELGNNALLARALGARSLDPFAEHHGQAIGFVGTLGEDGEDGLAAAELFGRVSAVTEREPLVFDSGPANVRRVAIVSGAGADYLEDAVTAGAQAFLTGEPAERVMAQAREAGVHFIAAGHYATETLGVKALGAHLAEAFGVRHLFLDVPNPV